jgi:hypothetical protein
MSPTVEIKRTGVAPYGLSGRPRSASAGPLKALRIMGEEKSGAAGFGRPLSVDELTHAFNGKRKSGR